MSFARKNIGNWIVVQNKPQKKLILRAVQSQLLNNKGFSTIEQPGLLNPILDMYW